MKFFQAPLSATSRSAIRRHDPEGGLLNFWAALLPGGVRYTHTHYRVGGADVGVHSHITEALAPSASAYDDMLTRVTQLIDVPVFPAFTAIRLAYSPLAKFGHHF